MLIENRVDQLLDWEFIAHRLAPEGLSVILVANAPTELFWRCPRYSRDVGDVLVRTHIGRYEGSKFEPGIWHLFTVDSERSAKALELVKDAIRARGLLPISKIALGDPVSRQWVPLKTEPRHN